MKRSTTRTYGLYPWTPDYGYRYVHAASRLHFEDVEPLGKVFELLGDAPPDREDEWILIRYDDQTYKVRPELFSPLTAPSRRLPFGFGDPVRERNGPNGQPPRRGIIADILWDTVRDRPRYRLWIGKRRGELTYEVEELEAD